MPKRPVRPPTEQNSWLEAKLEICYTLQRAQARHGLTYRQLAILCGMDASTIARATHPRQVHRVSFNQLFRLLNKMAITYRIMISI